MGSFSFMEIVTIVVVILIIFGPDRLPEFSRRIGELVAKARKATAQFTSEISGEFSDSAEPLKGAKADYEAIKDDLKKAGAAFTGYADMPSVDEMPSVDKKIRPQPEDSAGAEADADSDVETGEIEVVGRDEESE
jgi:Sec-independent protein translocase protein TatA